MTNQNHAEEPLGRLERINDVRQVWPGEATHFTPWLANDTNIDLLSDTIGIDLEVDAQEKDVGPFRADILCKNLANGDWVLVENQLERTDHSHLGQLMTYAAGLNAVTIVWIATRFTDEHRAAIDWLNEITSDDVNFFALELELWRIGNSEFAPKFNVVSQPNDWTRAVAGAAHQLKTAGLSETQQLQLKYWTAFRQVLEERGGPVRPTKPLAQHFQPFSIGRSGFYLGTFANARSKRIGIILGIECSDAKEYFNALAANRDKFELEFGTALEWDERPGRKTCEIRFRRLECDPSDSDTWPEQHAWLYENLQKFHKTFSRPIKQLSIDDLSDD